jgi:hypothetical protein
MLVKLSKISSENKTDPYSLDVVAGKLHSALWHCLARMFAWHDAPVRKQCTRAAAADIHPLSAFARIDAIFRGHKVHN